MITYKIAAKEDLELLIREAREKGVTEISLDATEEGRGLYEGCGFQASEKCMVLILGRDRTEETSVTDHA